LVINLKLLERGVQVDLAFGHRDAVQKHSEALANGVHVEPGGRLAPLRNDDAVVNDDDCGVSMESA